MEFGTITTRYSNVIIDDEHLTGKKPESTDRSPAQKVGFVSYTNDKKTKKGNLFFITDFILVGAFVGCPKRDDKWYPTAKKQAKEYKVAVNTPKFKKFFVDLDKFINSKQFMTDNF